MMVTVGCLSDSSYDSCLYFTFSKDIYVIGNIAVYIGGWGGITEKFPFFFRKYYDNNEV